MRRVYLVPKEYDMDKAHKEASEKGCPAIVQGISPRMRRDSNIKEEDLPCVYEEPELPQPPEPVDFIKELKKLEKRVKKLEGNKE